MHAIGLRGGVLVGSEQSRRRLPGRHRRQDRSPALSMAPSVRTRRGWEPLSEDEEAPRVLETDDILIRGLAPDQPVRVGPTLVTSDSGGMVTLRPATDDNLSGHVGLVEIFVGGQVVGELELVPDKLSERAYL